MSILITLEDCYNPAQEPGSASQADAGFRKEIHMFSRSTLLKTFLFVSTFLVITAAQSAAAPNEQPASSSAGSIHTYLMPDLSLKSVFSVPVLAQPSAAAFRKTCRCSCGTAPCANDADCGGGIGSCSAFISCCAKQPEAQWFQSSAEASRQTEPPVMNFKCK